MGFEEETEQEKKKVDKKEEKVEEKAEEKAEEKVKERVMVVKELPVQSVRESMNEEDNINTTFITQEEALTRIFEKLMGGDL